MLSILVGCYTDPDYGASRFKCDDTHGCPDGQTCISGACSPGSDGGVIGVSCGVETCGGGQQCCAGFGVTPHCIDLTMSCTGTVATCDGTEDCGGDPCCDVGGSTIECGTSCTNRICRDPSDCPQTLPMCCPSLTGAPWGRCSFSCL